ncbi:MOSC domain-containing protein, partial [Verrucomicrobiota bacterium]
MKVVSVNISEEKGTSKHSVPEIVMDERGVKDDAHAGAWHRQVSLLSAEIVKDFESEMGRSIKPGEFAENLMTTGLDLRTVSILDRLIIGQVELEVTQIGKECHGDNCAIFREAGKCVMPKEGIFCRVIKGGAVKPGDNMSLRE